MRVRSPFRPAAERLVRSEALDGVADALQQLVRKLVPDRTIRKDLLAGTLLGHPLHPLLTDVVIGSWTSAMFLDLIPSQRSRQAADTLIGLGILSAVPTAAAGLTDWSDFEGPAKRAGAFHAIGNVAGLSIYSLAWVARKRGNRALGWALSMLGTGVATASAYLGGYLVYETGAGVNQTAFEGGPTRWTAALALDNLPEEKITGATAKGVDVVLYRRGETIYALSARCTHRGCSLKSGQVNDSTITCRCHGSTFRLADGEVVQGPAHAPAPAYEVRVTDGKVEVRRAKAG
jgi:nitrite reductase/ring-hydroxylating ferredoxin subunit/uncharacterized membrane protein